MVIEGVAGELPAAGENVVAAGALRRDTQTVAGRHQHLLLTAQIVIRRRQGEGEVQIAHVVVHRPAAGEPPGQHAALLLQQRGAALPPCVLVPADDHRVAVLPQVQDAGILRHRLRQIRLRGQIPVGIGAAVPIGQQLPDHACHRRMGLRAACTSSGRPIWALWGAVRMASGSV